MASTKNTRIVIGNTTITANIKPDYIAEMRSVSKVPGLSMSGILNMALDLWLEVEAPVYLAEAKQAQSQWV